MVASTFPPFTSQLCELHSVNPKYLTTHFVFLFYLKYMFQSVAKIFPPISTELCERNICQSILLYNAPTS